MSGVFRNIDPPPPPSHRPASMWFVLLYTLLHLVAPQREWEIENRRGQNSKNQDNAGH